MTEEYDYRDLCPDGGDPEDFNILASTIVAAVKDMPAPETICQGYAKKVNRQLTPLKNALRKLPPDARRVIKDRELDKIIERRLESGDNLLKAMNNYETAPIIFGNNSILDQLELLVEEDYVGTKLDKRLPAITITASSIWKKHGGTVTSTENTTGFVAFLERLLDDAGLRLDTAQKPEAKTQIEKYLK